MDSRGYLIFSLNNWLKRNQKDVKNLKRNDIFVFKFSHGGVALSQDSSINYS